MGAEVTAHPSSSYGQNVIFTCNQPSVISYTLTSGLPSVVCPDLLRYEQIGAADRLRGRVVRAFFWLLRAWPP